VVIVGKGKRIVRWVGNCGKGNCEIWMELWVGKEVLWKTDGELWVSKIKRWGMCDLQKYNPQKYPLSVVLFK